MNTILDRRLAVVLALCLGSVVSVAGAADKVYCWKDKAGNRSCGDAPPPQFSGSAHEVQSAPLNVSDAYEAPDADEQEPAATESAPEGAKKPASPGKPAASSPAPSAAEDDSDAADSGVPNAGYFSDEDASPAPAQGNAPAGDAGGAQDTEPSDSSE